MKKIFTSLMVAMAFCTAIIAAETSKVRLKVYQKDGQAYECLLLEVDSIKFVDDDEEIEPETDSRDYVEDGALIAASYKVSDSTSVYFSQGNLQFNAKQGTHAVSGGTSEVAGTWRFAEKQYEYIGDANSNISSTYDGWIDLFGWGTGVYPTKSSMSSSDFGSFADWGINAISNGGNEPNKWRTLTTSEWQYLFQNNKWTLGYVKDGSSSYLCFMLIPATFTAPEGTTVTVLSTSTSSTYMSKLTVPSTNTYTTEQFAALERLGVVAFPCGGYRFGSTLNRVGSYGDYWSSSANDSNYAYEFYFGSSYVSSLSYDYRNYGRSVRLVQDL